MSQEPPEQPNLLYLAAQGRLDLVRVFTEGPTRPGDEELLAEYAAEEGFRGGRRWFEHDEVRLALTVFGMALTGGVAATALIALVTELS